MYSYSPRVIERKAKPSISEMIGDEGCRLSVKKTGEENFFIGRAGQNSSPLVAWTSYLLSRAGTGTTYL